MKKLLALTTLGLACAFGSVYAADTAAPATAPTAAGGAPAAKAPTAQQAKMKACNADAKGMKGDERKAFMKTCLSSKQGASTQQSKMKTCNAEAKGKKGDERKAFMSECLKK